MGRDFMAPAGKKCVLTGERFRLERASEEVYRAAPQRPRLLPPAAMTNERKMENTNAPRKTQYQAE